MKTENNYINFFGIGAAKSGTTFVANCLGDHPEICLSQPKEVNFFNKNFPSYLTKTPNNYQRGLKWYKKHFKHCSAQSIKGEFSVYYMPDQQAAERIWSVYPQAKIIAVLRNPVIRAFSHYKFRTVQPGKIKYKSFADAINKTPEFINWGFYYQQLKPYFDKFNKKNIHIIIFEELIKNPRVEIKKLYRFLGVNENFLPSSITKEINVSKNKNGWLRNKAINLLGLFNNSNTSFLIRLAHELKINYLVEFIDNSILSKRIKPPEEINPQTYNKLLKVYKNDIKSLEKLLDKNLSIWKK